MRRGEMAAISGNRGKRRKRKMEIRGIVTGMAVEPMPITSLSRTDRPGQYHGGTGYSRRVGLVHRNDSLAVGSH